MRAKLMADTCLTWYRRRKSLFTTDRDRNPPFCSFRLRTNRLVGIVTGHMASAVAKQNSRRPPSGRRIIVVVVPPVDELDLVGPLQVFNAVNRLAGRTIYT